MRPKPTLPIRLHTNPAPMPSILNISAYLFTPLPDAAALRDILHSRAQGLQLKGTVLLAHEGINMFLAGQAEQVRSFVAQLQCDERFAPRIELLIDDGQIVRQGDGVSSGVTRQLKAMLKDPLLLDQFEVLGEVLQGKEHAKTGLVVFRADDLSPTELTMFVQGLSRETEKTQNPKTNETVTLRKTARVDYLVAGEPRATATVTHPIVTREWIFR